MIEVMISMTVISIAVIGVMNSVTSSASLTEAERETSVAYRAAQRAIEQLQGAPFEDVWALYNASPNDDPPNDRTGAPGSDFDVPGLPHQAADPDRHAGHISFPINIGAGPSIVLLEDLQQPDFDLSSDRPTRMTGEYEDHANVSDVAGIDPARGYLLLPVRVEIEWAGVTGDRSIAVETILAPH